MFAGGSQMCIVDNASAASNWVIDYNGKVLKLEIENGSDGNIYVILPVDRNDLLIDKDFSNVTENEIGIIALENGCGCIMIPSGTRNVVYYPHTIPSDNYNLKRIIIRCFGMNGNIGIRPLC